MSLLQARGLAKSFGSRLILDGLDFDVEPDARMGVIGPNGGGKSTLLRILAGEEIADAGEVTRRRGLARRLPAQQPAGDDARRARDGARRASRSRRARAGARDGRARSSASAGERPRPDDASCSQRQEELARALDAAGGPGFEGRARALLVDVGLDDDELAMPTRASRAGSAS